MNAPELEFALGYFGIVPKGFRGAKEDILVFINNCPDDIKQKVLDIYPKVKERMEKERAQGIWKEVY